MTAVELYKLDCYCCLRTVELPAGRVGAQESFSCPLCGAAIGIDWRAERIWRSDGRDV
jgi:hypothetical protein